MFNGYYFDHQLAALAQTQADQNIEQAPAPSEEPASILDNP